MITVLIVDDEQDARAGIRSLLETEPDIEVAGESADARDAVEKIEVLRPDAMFLDVQMPGLTGIDMLKGATLTQRPYTVFVTGHEGYAIQAFEVQAIDYLLKPFDAGRFGIALRRLRMHLNRDSRASGRVDVDSLAAGPAPAPLPVSDRVPVKIGRRVRFLSVPHIRYIIADGNYVNIHMTTGEVIHTGERISHMEEKLYSHHFLRVHRSVILNIDQIREARTIGSYYGFTMSDGRDITSGLTYKKNILGLLSAWKKLENRRTS